MGNTANRTAEGAWKILDYNIAVLYHLPSRYKNLNRILTPVKWDLYNILHHIRKIEPIPWHQKYVWYLDTGHLTTRVRKRSSGATATSNRHFNFLCCIGVLQKLKQTEDNMLGVNQEFMIETGKKRPMNVFTVYRYTPKKLEQLEQRAEKLLKAKVTEGNISHDRLVASGLPELAREVYFANSDTSIIYKENMLKNVFQCVTELCEKKGYTTKAEVCRTMHLRREQLDNLLKVFGNAWEQNFCYKAPNKQEKEQYQITDSKWIITRREKENGKK